MESVTVLLSPEWLRKMCNRKDNFQSTRRVGVVLFPAELAPAGGECFADRSFGSPQQQVVAGPQSNPPRAGWTAGTRIRKPVLTVLTGFFTHLPVQSPLRAVVAEPVTASWTINFPTELRQCGEVWDIYFSQVSSMASGAKCDLLPKVARCYRWVSSVLLLSARKRQKMTLINYNLRPKPHL